MMGFGSKVRRHGVLLSIIGVALLAALAASLTTPLWAGRLEPLLTAQIKIASANQPQPTDATNQGSNNVASQPNSSTSTPADENAAAENRAWLGVEVSDADGGAKVVLVLVNSPASRAGVQQNDVINTIEGQAVANATAVVQAMQQRKPGDKVTLGITRGSDKMQIEVTAATAPAPPAGRSALGQGLLPSELQGLEGIALGQMFGHFVAGTFKMKDQAGNDLTINVTPGTVVTATANSLTIKPNDGSANRQFDVTDTTRLFGQLFRTSIANLQIGTDVLVVTVNDSTHASYVAVVSGGYSPLNEVVPQMRLPRLWSTPGIGPFPATPPKQTPVPKM